MEFEQMLIFYPLALAMGGIIYGFLDDNIFFILLTIGIFLCWIISENIKNFMPKSGIFLRPTKDPCNCHLFKDKCSGNEIGMPSTHATTMMFFVTMVYMYYGQKINTKVLFSFGLALLVMFQRYFSDCHSFLQLFSGSILGIVLGVIYFKIMKYFIKF